MIARNTNWNNPAEKELSRLQDELAYQALWADMFMTLLDETEEELARTKQELATAKDSLASFQSVVDTWRLLTKAGE